MGKITNIVLDENRKNVIIVEAIGATDEFAEEIARWVTDSELGTRIAFLMWRMRDEASITLFLMRWANNEILEQRQKG